MSPDTFQLFDSHAHSTTLSSTFRSVLEQRENSPTVSHCFSLHPSLVMAAPIREGYLHKAHPKESFLSMTVNPKIPFNCSSFYNMQVWQKRYFVLWSQGTLEYYTSYQKKGEEYRGTLNLDQCQDMEAPIAVGKRQNVIKLTVLKEGKEKDYWLDCDCPPVLNDWIHSLAEVSGLSPDGNKLKLPHSCTLSIYKQCCTVMGLSLIVH